MAAPNIAGPVWSDGQDEQETRRSPETAQAERGHPLERGGLRDRGWLLRGRAIEPEELPERGQLFEGGPPSEATVAPRITLEEQARLQQIAELSERLTAIESRDRGQRAGASSTADGVVNPGSVTTAGAIGSSGSGQTNRDRGQEPGGHPEDGKGDPEAVAKSICLRLLTGAARPRAGLATALRQRGIPDEVANRVLDRFVEVGLIDDVAYAEAFVAAKQRERALGVTALRMELRRKGVAEQTVDAAVSVLDQDAERQRAQALITRRVDSAMAHGPIAARRRLVALLARRGYSAELACQVVDAALAEYGADQGEGWFD